MDLAVLPSPHLPSSFWTRGPALTCTRYSHTPGLQVCSRRSQLLAWRCMVLCRASSVQLQDVVGHNSGIEKASGAWGWLVSNTCAQP